jgi:hypothetical protein
MKESRRACKMVYKIYELMTERKLKRREAFLNRLDMVLFDGDMVLHTVIAIC